MLPKLNNLYMQLHKTLALLFIALFTFAAVGCKKDKDTEPTRLDLLTVGEWRGDAIYIYGENETDWYLEVSGYDIKKNTVKYDRAGTYGDRYERVTINGDWEFSNNEQSILYDKGTEDEYTARIIKLSPNELQVEILVGPEDDPLPLEVHFIR